MIFNKNFDNFVTMIPDEIFWVIKVVKYVKGDSCVFGRSALSTSAPGAEIMAVNMVS